MFDSPNMIILWRIVRLRIETSAAPATHLHRITTVGEVSLKDVPIAHLFIRGIGVLIKKYGYPIKLLAGTGIYSS